MNEDLGEEDVVVLELEVPLQLLLGRCLMLPAIVLEVPATLVLTISQNVVVLEQPWHLRLQATVSRGTLARRTRQICAVAGPSTLPTFSTV